MRRNYFILVCILILALCALVINLPQEIPLRGTIGSFAIDRVIQNPAGRYFKTHLGLDLQGGTHLVLEAHMDSIAEDNRETALSSAKEVIERRVNFFGVSEPIVQSSLIDNHYRIIVELPGVSNMNEALSTVGQTAQLQFREFEGTPASIPTIFTTLDTGITGADLQKAQLGFHPTTGKPVVEFEMTAEGGKKFGTVTTRLVGKPLAIFLDNIPVSWPIIQEPITQGRGIISGGFTRDEGKRLALQLSAGALPVPIEVVEQKTIGATLGSESVVKSVRAGVVGLAMVALFMMSYYGYLGVLAVLSLVIYAILSFALFRIIPVTLTLPGIAGFILSIGMAVDSTILIFSRLKEEQLQGKSWDVSLEHAFERAWDSIRDANITTLITAFILYNPLNWRFIPTSGVVRGFAFTLALGIIMSLFTGIVVVRTLIRVLYRSKTNI